MTLQQASRLLLACTWLSLATLIAATVPPHIHEARQGPISIEPLSSGPGPESIPTSSSTTFKATTTVSATTMSPTSSSEPSLFPSLSASPLPSYTSSNTPLDSSSSSSGTLASPATSSATPRPSSSPASLAFTVQNLTTCTSAVISWKYSGTESQLSLSVISIGVPQYDGAVPRIKNVVDAVVPQQLADTNTSATPWPWQTVNLTQGWYEIQGLVLIKPTVFSTSPPFFVSDGPDVSCLTGTSPQSSSTASSSATSVPPPSGESKATVNVGGIAGGVIGGVVVLVLAILAGTCLSRRRRKASLGRRLSKPRKYGSLKSTTSSIQPGDGRPQLPGDHSHSHSNSTGAILQDVAGGGGRVSAATTPGSSDDHVTVVDDEKLASPASCPGISPFDALNTPLHHDRRTSTYSIQIPTAVASENFRSRVPSTHTSTQSLEQQAQRIRCSRETSNRTRSERLSVPTLPSPALAHSPTHIQPKEEYPLTPVNRSISAGAVSTIVRRTSRKPVPHYDPSVLLEDKNADSVSTHTAGAESSQSHGTELGTGVHGTPSDLVHKASFGDRRPVHYLIPDMPSPQLD